MTIWVDGDTGVDVGSSTEGSPWATFAYAAPRATAGETIYVAPRASGTYAGLTCTNSGTNGSPIIVRPWAVAGRPKYPVFTASSTRFIWRASNWQFYDIVFRGGQAGLTSFVIGDNDVSPQTNILFDGCYFGPFPFHAIRIASGDTIYFYRSTFYGVFTNISGEGALGILANHRAVGCRVWYSRFIDIGSQGIQLVEESGSPANWNVTNWSIEYNTFVANNESGAFSSRGYMSARTVARIGENGTATKQGASGVGINKNFFRGFRETTTGQDTAGGAAGQAHRSVNSGSAVDFKNNYVEAGDGIGFTLGFANPTVKNNLIQIIPAWGNGSGIKFQTCTGIVCLNNTVQPLSGGATTGIEALVLRDATVPGGANAGLKNNLFWGATVDTTLTGIDSDYNVWDVASGAANLVGANDVSAPATNLTDYGAPQTGSNLLAAGVGVGVASDFFGGTRPASVAIGAMELDIKNAYAAGELLNDPGSHRSPRDFYDGFTDAEYAMVPFAVSEPADYVGRWGYSTLIQDSTGKFFEEIFATQSSVRMRGYINTKWLVADTNGDIFTHVQARYDASVIQWRIDLIWNSSEARWYLRPRWINSSEVEEYLPVIGATGTPLDGDTWYRWEFKWGGADDEAALFLDEAGTTGLTEIDSDPGATVGTFGVSRVRIGAIGISAGVGANTTTTRYEDGEFFWHSPVVVDSGDTVIGDIAGYDSVIPVLVYEDDERLVSYWKFQQNAADSVGPNPLSPINGPTYLEDSAAIGGYEAVLNSASEQYFEIIDDDQTGLDLTTGGTIVGWATRTAEDTDDKVLVNKFEVDNLGYALFVSGNDTVSFTINSGGGDFGLSGAVDVALDTKIFYAATFDGTNLALYVDGILIDSSTFASTTIASTTTPFRLGAWSDGTPLFPWGGRFDYWAIFGEALSAEEIEGIRVYGILPLPVEEPDPEEEPVIIIIIVIIHDECNTDEYSSLVGTVSATTRCEYNSDCGLEHGSSGNNYAQYDLALGPVERFNAATFIRFDNLTGLSGSPAVIRFMDAAGSVNSLFYIEASLVTGSDITITVYYWNGSAYVAGPSGTVPVAGPLDDFNHIEVNVFSTATGGSVDLLLNGAEAISTTGLTGLDVIASELTSLKVGSIGSSNSLGGWVCQDYITISTLNQTIGPYLGGGGPVYGDALLERLRVGFISQPGRKPKADWFTGRN